MKQLKLFTAIETRDLVADSKTILERILKRIEIHEDKIYNNSYCWIWPGKKFYSHGKGEDKCFYGYITVRVFDSKRPKGVKSKTRHINVHKFVYTTIVGPMPEGLQSDHLCRTTLCCNPEHIEPVSSKENTLRGLNVVAINARKTNCPKCGSEFSTKKKRRKCSNTYKVYTERFCKPCKNAWHRNYYRENKDTPSDVNVVSMRAL